MKRPPIYRLRSLSVVDLIGTDAGTILHNLTTNDVQSLNEGQSIETFITDVRGKVLQHVLAIRTSVGFRLVGPQGEEGLADRASESGDAKPISYSQRLANHCDRYTIREDATPIVRDDDFMALVAGPEVDTATLETNTESLNWYTANWLGPNGHVALVAANELDSLETDFGVPIADEPAFHAARIRAGFPWYGVDFNEKHLPQEADRDTVTIDFKKGCYLGQETVARLDALGQVQKRIVRWRVPIQAVAGDPLTANGKTVGRLTSVTTNPSPGDDGLALGMARRSHFDPGSTAIGNAGQPNEYTAEVIISDV